MRIELVIGDPFVLPSLEPNHALARALIGMRGRLGADMHDAVRAVIRHVVEEITERLRKDFVNAVVGRRNRFRRIADAKRAELRLARHHCHQPETL